MDRSTAPLGSVTVPATSPMVVFCAAKSKEIPASNAQRNTNCTPIPIPLLKNLNFHLYWFVFKQRCMVTTDRDPAIKASQLSVLELQ